MEVIHYYLSGDVGRERERSQKSQFDGVIRRYLAAEEKTVSGETEFPSLIIACETLS